MTLVATDVGYRDDGTARAAAVCFQGWAAARPDTEHSVLLHDVAPYEPGRFYLRELPCLLAVLADLPVRPDLVIVDGHVWLREGQAGLGAHLHEATGLPVVGVAKRAFRDGVARPVCRGASRTPLHVTAVGTSLDQAVAAVARMHGPWRIPTLLRCVDELSRR